MHWIILLILASRPFISEGCQMDGVNWLVPTVIEINDTQNGEFFSRETTGILGYSAVTQGSQLVRGPYFSVSLVDSVFSIGTNEAFIEYEEYETAQSDSVSIVFNCQEGGSEFFAMQINIRDTNNNDPIFQPSDDYVFTVAPPLPPGFHLTDCVNDIIVRDIDLTTQRVNFEIEENPYLEILFDESATNEAKSFQAILRTTSFIRSLPEPLQLRISATDVDLTGDPSRTTYATITINADTDFELPTEPIFNEAFYFADYTEAHTIILEQRISLLQGYDDLVTFALEGDYKDYFTIDRSGNEVSVLVVSPLSYEDIPERQIFLVVTAEREYTSGASTTLIVNLPEEIPLLFEEAHYEGRIEDNNLYLQPLILQEGYESRQVEIQIISEYSSYFSDTLDVNVLTLTMLPLDEESIKNNNFITLQIIATNGFTSSTTIVNLEIIKDDTLTPVFEQSLYVGTLETESGLNIEKITLKQGYDSTVTRNLSGEHKDYFTLVEDGPSVTLSQLIPLTQEILTESDITLFVDVSKPRTVGATAVIKIVLPTIDLLTLRFTQNNYVGTLDNNDLEITPISLLGEAPDDITLNVLGDLNAFFRISGDPDSIEIELIQELSPEILERNLIVFDIEASSQDVTSGYATIVIEIIKEKNVPIGPEFEQAYYVGQYSELSGLDFQGTIRLSQGFDSTVNFTTSSDQLEWFQTQINENEILLGVPETIPQEVLENNDKFILVITAENGYNLKTTTTIIINVQKASSDVTILGFEQASYIGSLENSTLTINSITLLHGYTENVEFTLHGDFGDYFESTSLGSTVTISLLRPIPQESLITTKFIVLELRATAPQAITATATIVLEVIQSTDLILVSLSEVFYSGQYNSETSVLTFAQDITLAEGNDKTVEFELEGDDAQWFALEARENNVQTLVLPSPLPAEVLKNRNMLVFVVTATKPGANTARSTIAISVSDSPENTLLGFEQPNYVGTLEDSTLNVDSITLLHGYSENVEFTLHGEFQDYFDRSSLGSTVTISLLRPIPQESLITTKFIVLELRATAPQAITASATIVLEVIHSTDLILVSLSEVFYSGQYNSETSVLTFAQDITLAEGNDETVEFELEGDDAQWFALEARENNVQTLVLPSPLPAEVLENRNMLVFVVTATKPGANTARSTIAISVSDSPENTLLGFEQPNYVGTLEDSTLNVDSITLLHGYSENVEFTLHGEFQDYFDRSSLGSTVTISLLRPIPQESLITTKFIVLELRATAPQAITASATIVLEVIHSTDLILVSLSEVFYSGQYNSETSVLTFAQDITLAEGNDETVEFELEGDDAQWFALEARENNVQTLVLPSPLPAEVLENRNMLVFVVTATKPGANTARSTIAISVSDSPENTLLGFEQPNYVGTLEDSTLNVDSITLLHGYSKNVEFTLHGEFQDYFDRSSLGSTVTISLLRPIPQESLITTKFIVLELRATAPQAITASATIVLEVIHSTDLILVSLSEVFYSGQYNSETSVLTFEHSIALAEGNDETVEFEIVGDDAQWFELEARENNVQTLVLPTPLPAEVLENRYMFVFVITATKPGSNTARSTIAISVTVSNLQTEDHLVFSETYYRGEYVNDQLVFEDIISLTEGYDEMVEFTLDGDGSEYFELVPLEPNNITLHLPAPLPEHVTMYRYLIVFAVVASKPGTRTVKSSIIVRISEDSSIGPTFGQVVFEGVLHVQTNDVQHEDIIITNYHSDTIHLIGEYASLFGASAINGLVQINIVTSLTLPSDLKFIVLEMEADTASAALVLEINQDEENPVIPTVTFTSQAYVFRVDVSVSGTIGRVEASADNGETITYSLITDNGHLQERLYVNNEGEIHLSAPANSGVYNFEIAATTIFTRATATAAGHMTVEVVTVPDCDNDELVMPPLIVLDRDEEEEHQNLVVLDSTRYEGCHFTLNNRWPTEQDWLYVDEYGLHTRRIDREDPKVAFMALSQVQVELILECDSSQKRAKRSVNTRYDWLGPYDYGVNKWILTDSILYNSKRSFVNLIVNDINDNPPVFIGKENEPLVVGYPTSEIENTILPRSLAELQATDADIGENAALFYWTSHDAVAVSPITGFVHVKNLDLLEDGLELTIFATDQNGQGPNRLTGSITLTNQLHLDHCKTICLFQKEIHYIPLDKKVKMLEVSHIAVVTIKDAFLEDEAEILQTLSTSVGYDIKLLRSVITSQDVGNSENRRRVRSDTNGIGTSLQLYVYGILNKLPVEVTKIAQDIDSNVSAVSVILVTLEEHLQNLDTCVIPGHDVGLLASTIVLSVLLFILIAAIVVWYFLKWKKNQVRVYEQFSDGNSLASTIASTEEIPKPEQTKPRLNIQELKKSERRLQEMLDAPFVDISVESPKRKEETLVNIPTETHSPIVIQSIDKLKNTEESDEEDEFGKVNQPRKKSVVTFNENVEKIIHVEDIPDSNDSPGYEIYKL